MPHIYLALGSNQGDRLALLGAALGQLASQVSGLGCSAVYETAAAYVEDQPAFYNCVVRGTTSLAPLDLLTTLKAIEYELGRRVGLRYGPRPIDLDILLYDELVFELPDLTIPHPRMAERTFVLVPLADLAPALILPGTAQQVAELAAQSRVGGVIAKISPPLC